MTERTHAALSYALELLRGEIRQKQSLISMVAGVRRDSLWKELDSLQLHEKELTWLAALYRPRSPEEVREDLARSIYINMPISDKPEWVPGGTSELQEVARAAAEKMAENLRRQVAGPEQGVLTK